MDNPWLIVAKESSLPVNTEGWCPYMYAHLLPELQSSYAPKIANGLQKQATNPSGNQQDCIDDVWRQVRAIMKNEFHDPTGLLFRAASGVVPRPPPHSQPRGGTSFIETGFVPHWLCGYLCKKTGLYVRFSVDS